MKNAAQLALALALVACRAPVTGSPPPAPDEHPAATHFATVPDEASGPRTEDIARDSKGRPLAHALVGKPLPVFISPMLDGSVFDSATLSRWTVIQIWGVWCHDSRADGPFADALSRAIAQDPDLDFVSVHVPQNAARISPDKMFGTYGSIEAYFESTGHRYPVVLDSDGQLRDILKINWTPTYLLVSPDGIVRGFRTELAAAGGEPVKDFLREIETVKSSLSQTTQIGPNGAIGLNRQTVFTLPAIAAAFPGHEIVSVLEGEGAERRPVFLARSPDGATRFRIAPDWTLGYVGLVSTRDPAVRGPDGTMVGKTKLNDLSGDIIDNCAPVQGRPDLVACPSKTGAQPGTFVWLFDADPRGGAARLLEMQYRPPLPAAKSP